MATQKRQLLKYSPEDMEAALEDCDRGLPIATSAKKHNVPRITLLYKFRGKVPRRCTMGLKSYLSREEETILCQWLIQTARAGFPVGRDQLLDSVQELMVELKRENPFQNNRPGKSWYKLFLKRNPEISARTPQNLTSSRASVTKEKIDSWFTEVYEYLKSQNLETILNYPERVFNADEAAFFLNPKGDKVLAKKGEKNVYQIINSDEKECLTVLLTANAAGNMAPPMVIFKYERIPKEIAMSVPKHWGIGKSESGWMTRETFFEFITNIFHPWLIENKIQLPIILFIDGHVSHLTLHLSRFCNQNGIILVALYPNATHLIQPMDVAVFRTVKAGWKKQIHLFRLERTENQKIKKTDFCPLLAKTLAERLDKSVLGNGFRKCGLVPWNPEEVFIPIRGGDNHILPIKKDYQEKLVELKKGKEFLEKYIDPEKIKQFKAQSDRWTGPVEDLSLYNFYIEIIRDIENYNRDDIKSQRNEKGKCNNIDIIEESSISETGKEIERIGNEPIPSTSSNAANIKVLSDVTIPQNDKNNINHATPVKVGKENINLTPKKQDDSIIPSPFKRALTWPEPKPLSTKKRILREKIPSVVTSKQWQMYYENKENKKREEEMQKKVKAEERQKRKEMQEKKKQEKLLEQNKKKLKKHIISSDSETSEEWQACDTTDDEITSSETQYSNNSESLTKNEEYSFKENDYVLVSFPGKKREHIYLCVIQELLGNNEAEVVGLKKCEDRLSFKLNETDVSVINLNQIKEKLNFPKIIIAGDRLKYQFNKELDVEG